MKKLLIYLLVIFAMATLAYGQDIAFVRAKLSLEMEDMALRGDYAYCAMGYGLMVLDISDYAQPAVVANVYGTFEEIREIVLEGNYAYSFSSDHLYIFNITDPANPGYVGAYEFDPGSTTSVVLAVTTATGYLYAANYNGMLQVYSLSNPEAPSLIDSKDLGEIVNRVEVSDTVLYVATEYGLYTFGITNPASLNQLGFYSSAAYFSDVAVSDTIAFVAEGRDEVVVLDISNPAIPQFITSFTTGGSPYLVEASGDYCYVGDTENGIYCYDVSNPASPTLEDNTVYYGFFDIEGDVLAIAWQGVYGVFFDLTIPNEFGDEGRYYCGNTYKSPVVVDGNYLYTAGQHVIVYDIENPEDGIECIGGLYTQNATSLQISGDYAFIGCRDSTVKSIDISDKTAPAFSDVALIPDGVGDIAISGDYLFASNTSALAVLNITDPTFMTTANSITQPHYFDPLAIQGSLLFRGAVTLFEITDPANPSLLLDSVVMSFVQDTDVDNGVLYGAIAYSEPYMGALARVSFAFPETPNEYPILYTENELAAVDAKDADVVVVDYAGNAMLIDVTMYDSPDSVATILPTSYSNPFKDVELQGDFIYLSSRLGVSIFTHGCVCGDINSDGGINIGDVTYAINYIFKGGPPPPCYEAMDVNCDGNYNIGDAVYLIVYIFQGGSAPCEACP